MFGWDALHYVCQFPRGAQWDWEWHKKEFLLHSCSGPPQAGTSSLLEPAAPENQSVSLLAPSQYQATPRTSGKETQPKAKLDHVQDEGLSSALAGLRELPLRNRW